MSILVVAETCRRKLSSAALSTVSAAKALSVLNGAPFDILALGAGAKDACDDLSDLGAANVYFSEDHVVTDYTAEAYASAVATVVWNHGHRVVMAPDTTNGKDLTPKLAWLMNSDMVSDVIGFESAGYLCPMYAVNGIGKVEIGSDSDITFMTVDETAFGQAEAEKLAGHVAITKVFFEVDDLVIPTII